MKDCSNCVDMTVVLVCDFSLLQNVLLVQK